MMKQHSPQEIDEAIEKAGAAFLPYRRTYPEKRAFFLETIGRLINDKRNDLSRIAGKETHLPNDRLQSEITRTIAQCTLFASLLREGSWVRAIIDTGDPDRTPAPRPDLRQMQQPIGPVAVFGASNFPFAYSVCGGDTIAALAAGCPVVYKVNPGHPQTSDDVAALALEAARLTGMPENIFCILHGASAETGMQIVMHPQIKAVGFTGSLKGGRALFDAAATRAEPIPVYAEMGSTNPVFILPEILESKPAALAHLLAASNTASVGQFCTNPGIMVAGNSPSAKIFYNAFSEFIRNTPPAPMLTPGIFSSFENAIEHTRAKPYVELFAASSPTDRDSTGAYLFHTTAEKFLKDPELSEEMFGPSSVQVTAKDMREMTDIAKSLPGQITVSVWGTETDFRNHAELLGILELKAGRIIINGVPTGVEVTHAMNHGGPYPATTDVKFTSVGTQSIYRFTRPICYQNFPQQLLPEELKDENAKNIWRMVNGELTKISV